MSEKSFIGSFHEQLKQSKSDNNVRDHFLIAVEVEHGVPVQMAIVSQGSPVELLGMLEIVEVKLKESREAVHAQLLKAEARSGVGGITEEIQKQLLDIRDRALKALKEGNIEEASKIQEEAIKLLKEKLGKDFSINPDGTMTQGNDDKEDDDPLNKFKNF